MNDLDLTLDQGDRLAVLGPNGAGKTTLLKLIAGLLSPYSGGLEVFGADIDKDSAERLGGKVGLLFQDPDDQIFMPKVRDDIAFGPVNLGLNEDEVRRRVASAMRRTDLVGFGDRSAHHLSVGEKKRVAIAGIMAMRPRLLLLDEPTGSLDPRGREELIDLVNRLKTTVVVATHNINTAIRMADKALVLKEKKLAYGSLRDIFTDEKLLREAHLVMPDITKLFSKLEERGYYSGRPPLTVAEALSRFENIGKRSIK